MKNTFIIFLLLLSVTSKASMPSSLRIISSFEHCRNKVTTSEDMYISWVLSSYKSKPDVYNIRVSNLFGETIQEFTSKDDYMILDKELFSKIEYNKPFLISVSAKGIEEETTVAFELIDDKLLKRKLTSFQDSLNYLLDYGCFSNLFKLLKDKQADYFIDEIISKYKRGVWRGTGTNSINLASDIYDCEIIQDDDSLRLLKRPDIQNKDVLLDWVNSIKALQKRQGDIFIQLQLNKKCKVSKMTTYVEIEVDVSRQLKIECSEVKPEYIVITMEKREGESLYSFKKFYD